MNVFVLIIGIIRDKHMTDAEKGNTSISDSEGDDEKMQEFKEILTSLFNGNVGEAEQAVETISYDNTFNLSEEYDRRKQDRINYFEVLKLKRLAENS